MPVRDPMIVYCLCSSSLCAPRSPAVLLCHLLYPAAIRYCEKWAAHLRLESIRITRDVMRRHDMT